VPGRADLTSHRHRKNRARLLAESDTCHWCGHPGADTADHLQPVARGGAPLDPENLGPIHGVAGCPTCGRKCNNEKGAGGMSARLVTSRDWYAKP
jgi:hypothetical protein